MGLTACPRCRALFDARERACPECGMSTRPREAREKGGWFDRLDRRGVSVVTLVILANIGFYVAMLAVHGAAEETRRRLSLMPVNPEGIQTFGGLLGYEVLERGHWWRLVCPIFLHFDLVHLGFNCFLIHYAGRVAEKGFGPAAFLALYVLTGVIGCVTSLAWHGPNIFSAGASGAGFGILGMSAVYGFRTGDEGIKRFMIQWAVIGLLFGMSGGVDNAAHLGGLGAGVVLGKLCPLGVRIRLNYRRVLAFDVLAVASIALVVASFLFALA